MTLPALRVCLRCIAQSADYVFPDFRFLSNVPIPASEIQIACKVGAKVLLRHLWSLVLPAWHIGVPDWEWRTHTDRPTRPPATSSRERRLRFDQCTPTSVGAVCLAFLTTYTAFGQCGAIVHASPCRKRRRFPRVPRPRSKLSRDRHRPSPPPPAVGPAKARGELES